jgi:proteic killer suppression protein
MILTFKNFKLEKEFSNQKTLIKNRGAEQGKMIMRRLDQLRAADNLEVMITLPQVRAHELKGGLNEVISLDLNQPYRLLIKPDHEETPRKNDGGLDWKRITKVMVWGVEDTHG